MFWGNADKKISFNSLAIIFVIYLGVTNDKVYLLALLLVSVLFSDQICLWVFKKNIRRFRPKTWLAWGPDEEIKKTHRYYFEKYLGYSDKSLSSMCSSHAANYLTQAIILDHFVTEFAFLFYAVAFLVSFGRYYIGAHWLSDILVGWIVACVTAYTMITYVLPFLEQII